jgi:hypothetical protein
MLCSSKIGVSEWLDWWDTPEQFANFLGVQDYQINLTVDYPGIERMDKLWSSPFLTVNRHNA